MTDPNAPFFEEEEPACVFTPHTEAPQIDYEGYTDDFQIEPAQTQDTDWGEVPWDSDETA